MAVAAREVAEGHAERAADACIDVLDLAEEAVGRQPSGQRIGVGEGAIDLLGLGTEHAVQADGTGGHVESPSGVMFCWLPSKDGWGTGFPTFEPDFPPDALRPQKKTADPGVRRAIRA